MTKQKKTMVLMLCLVLFFTIFPLGTGCRELKKDVKITDIHQADETTVSITFEVEKAQRFLVIYHSGTMVEVTATPTEERRESGDFCDVNSYPMQIYTQLVEIEPLKNKSKEMTFVVHNTYSYMYDKEREFSDKATLTVYRELPNKDIEPPVPGNDGQIQIADVGTDSIRTKWTVATDNITAKEDLKYCVYYSTQDNMNTPDEAMKNGTVSGIARKNMTETVITGLAPGDYYLTVTVEDEAGNKAVYTKATATIPDADPPTPGAGGSLDIATTTPTSIAVKWEAATDNVTAQGDLEYLVYYS